MACQPEDEEDASRAILVNRAEKTRDREYTLQMLKRVADALGKPVEHFFEPDAASDPTSETDGSE